MYGIHSQDMSHEQERYEEWCEENDLDFNEDHWEAYADHCVGEREARDEERIERGEWGLAYL